MRSNKSRHHPLVLMYSAESTNWGTLQIELEFGNAGFWGEGEKLEYPEKNLSQQGGQPTTIKSQGIKFTKYCNGTIGQTVLEKTGSQAIQFKLTGFTSRMMFDFAVTTASAKKKKKGLMYKNISRRKLKQQEIG